MHHNDAIRRVFYDFSKIPKVVRVGVSSTLVKYWSMNCYPMPLAQGSKGELK
jgi:hypothetical protein